MNEPSFNPYLAGRQEWLERYGDYIQAARQWRLIAFSCLALALVAAVGNVIQARQYKVVPYVVAVDKIGAALAVHRADQASPTPRTVIQAELANTIINWRTVTADLDLQSRMVERLSAVARGSAKGVLTGWFAQHNPGQIARSGKLVSVAIKGLPLPVSQDSWRVEWLETIRNQSGQPLSIVSYEATMTVALEAPATDAQIMKNPGGVYVTGLSFSQVFHNQETASAVKENDK